MGKKKKHAVVKDEKEAWCYYCDRIFEHEEVLIQHQKAKHFKCPTCNKKLSTAGGLVVHNSQVHKETITEVPNSKEGRQSIDFEIYGINGIPEEAYAERVAKKARIAEASAQAAPPSTAQEIPAADIVAPAQPGMPAQGMPHGFDGQAQVQGMLFHGGAPVPGMGFHPAGQLGFPGMGLMGGPRPGFNPMQQSMPQMQHGGPHMMPHMFGGPRGPTGHMFGGAAGPMHGGYPRGPGGPPAPPPRGMPPGHQLPPRPLSSNEAPPPPGAPRGPVRPLFPAGAGAAEPPVIGGPELSQPPPPRVPGEMPRLASGLPGEAQQTAAAVTGDEEFSMEEKRAELSAYKV